MSDTIISERGLRQGDPFSLYLFILYFKVLSKLLLWKEANRNIYGIKVRREAPMISHLLYVNDLVIA